MSDSPVTDDVYDIACPHCKKQFTATLIAGSTARHRGFKCPHCKLFVPFARVSGEPVNAD
jgi:hypothetical protein